MGCSSSAPSYVDSSTQHANATEDFETVENKIEEHIQPLKKILVNNLNKGIDSENGDIVLPESDIVAEPLDVVRNEIQQNSDIVEKFVTNADVSIDSEYKINEKTVIEVLLTEKKEAEERRQRELDFLEEFAKLTEESVPDINADTHETVSSDNIESIDLSEAIDAQEKVVEASDADDALSESSRTTRWEALADVVAELPPSLTIDPVTGHIYTLK